MRRLPTIVIALALLGCGNRNFNTPQLLDVPRILAIQAEPPQPRVGTATTLQALVSLPPDEQDNLTYTWSWCPLRTSSSNGYACPLTHDQFAQFYGALGLGAAPPFELGTGTTGTLVNPFPAEVLASICNGSFSLYPGAGGGSGDAGKSSVCSDGGIWGYPITIYLSVGPTSLGTLDAVFTVYLPTDDSVLGNANPIIGRVQATWPNAPDGGTEVVDAQSGEAGVPTLDAGDTVDGGASPDGGAGGPAPDATTVVTEAKNGVVLDDVFSTLLPRQQRIDLHAQIPESASEPYTDAQATAADYANNPELSSGGRRVLGKRLTERLDLSWFTDAGSFGEEGEGGRRTGFLGFPDDIDSPFSGAVNDKWTLPKSEDYPGDKARLIVVVRDNRGGVAWTTGSATLEPKP
jgi:hypothetical protein